MKPWVVVLLTCLTGIARRRESDCRSQAALEAVNGAKPRVVHDHGSEFVNRDVAAVIKTHNLIDIKTKPRHPESNGIVERFNGTVRDESNNDYGNNYLQAEAIIAKLM
jgi:transposase InsO family protein